MESIISNHLWIAFILITCLNAWMLKMRSKKYIRENPTLEMGYEKYFQGYLIFFNIPWIIIGLGNLSGITNSISDYFNPKLMNPMVLFFHASIVALWILSVWWIYFKDGAEFIEKHPGGASTMTATQVKLFFPVMLLGGIIGMVMMWVVDMSQVVN